MQGKQYQTQSLCLRFPLALVSVDSEMPPQPHQCLVVRVLFGLVWCKQNQTKRRPPETHSKSCQRADTYFSY